MTNRPTRIWRVEYEAATGYPEPDVRQNAYRHCFSAEQAGRQVAVIAAMPTHLKLHRVMVTTADLAWQEIDPDTLPVPNEQEALDDVGL